MMDINDANSFPCADDSLIRSDKVGPSVKELYEHFREKRKEDHFRGVTKMVPRLIDANELLKKKFTTREFDGTARGWTLQAVSAYDIENAPTIEPESLRAHGRWEKANINGYLCCSACKDVYIYEGWLESGKWIFCPKCGAKMDKETNA